MDALIHQFSTLEDPRKENKLLYRLIDISVIGVCAAIAGAESYEDTAVNGESKEAWLAEFLNLEHGIPSHHTFRRVFGLVDAEAFEACFAAWTATRISSLKGKVVAIDGKIVRRSFDSDREQPLCTW